MYRLLSTVLAVALPVAAGAKDIQSAYTQLVEGRDCAVFAGGSQDQAHWADLVCSGYKGYPIFVYFSDARESLFYGFPPTEKRVPAWESFAGFNHSGPTVEWRVTREGGSEVPFATIHRWSVSTGDTPQDEVEVLVIEKVGQIGAWDGCTVGYVVATGNPDANEQARRVADKAARGFDCGADQPAIHAGSIPLPEVTRGDEHQRP